MKLKKRLAVVMATMMCITSMPVWANDYSEHWAKEAIEKWSENGIVKGYEDGSFKPNEKATRAQVAAFVVRVFGLSDVGNAKEYDDIEEDKWYTSAVHTISSAGIMNDYGDAFRPHDFATREETAYVLANAYRLTGKTQTSFEDEELISEWAKDQIEAMVEHGIIRGKTENTMAPQDAVTRAEIVTMLDKLTAKLYNQAGTYTYEGVGNVVVNTEDVVLKDTIIEGNLYITEGVGNGDVVLDNTHITGRVIIEGGGENSIKFTNGSSAQDIKVAKVGGNVRVFIDQQSTVAHMVLETGAKVDGSVDTLLVETTQPVELLSGSIKHLVVSEKNEHSTIMIGEKVEVKEALFNAQSTVSGKGTIESVVITAGGVTLENKPVNIVVEGDITASVGGNVVDKDTIHTPPKGETSGGGGSNQGGQVVNRPSTWTMPSRFVQSEIAKTKSIKATVNLRNARLQEKEKFLIKNSNIGGWMATDYIDPYTFTFEITDINHIHLSDSWNFTIPKEVLSINQDLEVSIPIEQDAYGFTMPTIILKDEFEKHERVGATFNLVNTKLTKFGKEFATSLENNIGGSMSIGGNSDDAFGIYYDTRSVDKDQLPDEWEITVPASVLSSDEDLKFIIPLVERTPENIVDSMISKIPSKFTMSLDYEGDNLYRYLEHIVGMERYPGATLNVRIFAFDEWVEEDGTVNYHLGGFGTVPMQVEIRYDGVDKRVGTGLDIVNPDYKPGVPNRTQRLTTTPGALTIEEGEHVTFEVTTTTDSALFIEGSTPIQYKDNLGFSASVRSAIISEDGKKLRLDVVFRNVRAGARFDFYIPEDWFTDGVYRQTELITVKKK